MAKKTIEDVINSLSEEEKENLKDLIRETLEGDRTIKENAEKALKALKSFSEYSRLLQSLEEEKAALRRIKEELQLIRYTMYLTAIPDSKFHRA
jgi:superfamily I DNA/RNA helicase